MTFGWPHPSRRFIVLALACAMALGVAPEAAIAQEEAAPGAPADTAGLEGQDESDETDGSATLPLPIVFYQPETGLGFGASLLTYYQLTPGDTVSPPSSLALIGIYTTKNQVEIGFSSDMYFDADRWRVSLGAGYSKFPNKFWGIGNDTPDEAEEDYTPISVRLLTWPQKRIAEGWFAGFGAALVSRKISDVEDGGMLDSGVVPGTDDGQILGFRGSLIRDTRDSTIFPRRGAYHQLLVDGYPEIWIADYGFARYTLDLRGYVPVTRTHVLALRALGVASSGEPPFDQLAELGGDSDLRGYYQGRYRDRHLISFHAEYRLPLFWRVGAVGFVGAGQVAESVSGFGLDRFWPSGGLGLRFLAIEETGLNIRADVAIGDGDSGFYLGVGEVF